MWCVVVLVRVLKADSWPVLSVDSVTIPTVSTSRSVYTLITFKSVLIKTGILFLDRAH